MTEFLSMGGYAAYVWPAYGITVIVGAAMGLHSLRRFRQARDQVTKLEKERSRRTGAPVA